MVNSSVIPTRSLIVFRRMAATITLANGWGGNCFLGADTERTVSMTEARNGKLFHSELINGQHRNFVPQYRPITRIKLHWNVPHGRNRFPKLKIESLYPSYVSLKKQIFVGSKELLDPLKRKINPNIYALWEGESYITIMTENLFELKSKSIPMM